MSYNGIGLRTVRGSGTNGYIQKNRSSISHLHRNDNPPDLKPPVAKKPNAEIIDHERKRQIELKVLMYEEKLKERKTPKDEIKKKCKVLREQLQEQFARDPSAMKSNLSESHQKNAAKHKEDAKLRNAFDIKTDHVEGAAYEQIGNPGYMARDTFGKAAAIAASKAKQKEKEEKELAEPKLPKSFLSNSVYTEDELRERKARERQRRAFSPPRRDGGDHWRPRGGSSSRSRSRSRDHARGKGIKRSRSFDNKKKREKSKSPPKKAKAVTEPTPLTSLLLPQANKKDKKQKKAKGKKKESSSDSSSSSSSDSDSSSGSDSSSSSNSD